MWILLPCLIAVQNLIMLIELKYYHHWSASLQYNYHQNNNNCSKSWKIDHFCQFLVSWPIKHQVRHMLKDKVAAKILPSWDMLLVHVNLVSSNMKSSINGELSITHDIQYFHDKFYSFFIGSFCMKLMAKTVCSMIKK